MLNQNLVDDAIGCDQSRDNLLPHLRTHRGALLRPHTHHSAANFPPFLPYPLASGARARERRLQLARFPRHARPPDEKADVTRRARLIVPKRRDNGDELACDAHSFFALSPPARRSLAHTRAHARARSRSRAH